MLRCSATRAMTRTLHEPWPRPKRPPSARDPPGQSAAPPENRRVNQPETVSCGANEPPCRHGLPPPCDRPVAAHAAAAQPKRPVHIGPDGEVGRCLAPPTVPPSPLAE